MGIRWNIDHMNKSFFLNDLGKIEEVKNVFYENEKINLKKIKVGSVERKVSEFLNYFDYNTSFDDIQLPTNPEARDLLMQEVLRKISEIKEIDTSYFSKKKLKNGEIKEYFCLRKQSLAGTFFFYHNNTEDHPHFHICMPKKVYTGKGCLRLRKELNSIFKEYGLIPNCEIVVDANEKNTKKLLEFREVKNKLEKFSWLIKQAETKVTNPSGNVKDYILSKRIIVNEPDSSDNNSKIFVYRGNNSYFSFTKNHFDADYENKKIKVYSIFKLISDYRNLKTVGGSNQFVFEVCDSIDKIFFNNSGKKIYNILNRINISEKKVDFEDNTFDFYSTKYCKDIIESLTRSIFFAEKINPEFKKFWRKNFNSEDKILKFTAEGIQKLYSLRKNKVFDFDQQKIKECYSEIKNGLAELFDEKEKTEKIVTFYETLLKKEVVNEANINQALKQEFGLEKVYTKKIEDTQFLILETAEFKKMKIELTQTLKKFAEKEGINFVTSYQIIKNNQLKNLCLNDIEETNLKQLSEIFLENIVDSKKSIFLNPEVDFQKIKSEITETINLNSKKLILQLYKNFEKGLSILASIFKKIINFLSFDFLFSDEQKNILEIIEEKIKNDFEEYNFENDIDFDSFSEKK